METPGMRFERRMAELGIEKSMYGINCKKHGIKAPVVYDSNVNNFRCRACVYHEIMRKGGIYYKKESK